ncbi:hypothetical protein XM38_036350 [Halomicronema hongdechloris C2206]|uniref:Uncharacterized protein n=1 Tax=Halomicronema hongdechloris C2206 TaxID=1641165 RepID=A0A1Z3HRB2_9CYAN|nr:hypothetical protein [Halomicronema hongdechloris]ASC72677.1 hypothetical protein XM38_036350 [Halomicronema hongdechloris C2206]
MRRRRHLWLVMAMSLWLVGCWLRGNPLPADQSPGELPNAPDAATEAVTDATPRESPEQLVSMAIRQATAAADLAETAESAADWDQVTQQWLQASQSLQAVPPQAPQRVFVQRKLRQYLAYGQVAQRQAERASVPRVFPSLGSAVLDEKIGLYLSYVATVGVPDVMVIGSSRALQGIDPQVLQAALAQEGLTVFNFGINGATAQLMSFLLRQVLTPDQLPQILLWGVGSRSFNSGRVDRTFAAVLRSPGYQALQSGERPSLEQSAETKAVAMPVSEIDAYGFLAQDERFNPGQYYRQFSRVPGEYDSAYQPFRLQGVQTQSLHAIAAWAQSQQIPLVIVNLPLSDDYLDPVRLGYERQFQNYLQTEAQRGNFQVLDWLLQWRQQDGFFADPSHLNQFGAAALSRQLAATAEIPWPTKESATDE